MWGHFKTKISSLAGILKIQWILMLPLTLNRKKKLQEIEKFIKRMLLWS